MENNLIDCFLHLPMSENIPFILMYANITQDQPGEACQMMTSSYGYEDQNSSRNQVTQQSSPSQVAGQKWTDYR
jgi:hypothetical protein